MMTRGGTRIGIITKGLLLALIGSTLAFTSAVQEKGTSLVLITVDTLRVDHLSSFDQSSPVRTPFVDSLAADGILFRRALTTNPITFPAHSSLLTGTWPLSHGVRDFTGSTLAEREVTLAEVLKEAGYTTAAFVSAAVLDNRTGIGQGFDVYDDGFETFLGEDSRVAERRGPETLARALSWLESGRGTEGPFFLWVHLFEPHDPYEPPEPYRSQYRDSLYAGEVAYVDSLVGQLLAELKTRGLYDSSVICLLSDHGEGLGDHGESKHGFFVYQSTIHVPWILKFAGGTHSGRAVEANVSIVDVFPTLMHGLEIDRRHWPSGLQGRSRYRLISGGNAREEPLYAESVTPRNQYGWNDLRVLQSGRYKLIDTTRPELYDLRDDPGETKNLFQEQSAVGLRLRRALAEFEGRYETSAEHAADIDTELQERLRSLGYIGSPTASGGVQASREGLIDPKDRVTTYEKVQQGVELSRERRWDDAIAVLEQAAREAPEASSIASSLALTCRDAGRPRLALQWFDTALRLAPGDTYMRLQLARFLMALRRPEEARVQFELILQSDPRNFLALFNLGVYWGRKPDLDKAGDYLARALSIREDGEAARMLALTLAGRSRFEEAVIAYLKALAVDPGSTRAHAGLADVYEKLGRTDKAEYHRMRAKGRQ